MEKDKDKTKVIFRFWKESKDVIAIFPEIPGTMESHTCQSYEHIGQHGACSPAIIIDDSRLAKPEEYKDLKKELRNIGYNLEVVKRYTRKLSMNRVKELESYNC